MPDTAPIRWRHIGVSTAPSLYRVGLELPEGGSNRLVGVKRANLQRSFGDPDHLRSRRYAEAFVPQENERLPTDLRHAGERALHDDGRLARDAGLLGGPLAPLDP